MSNITNDLSFIPILREEFEKDITTTTTNWNSDMIAEDSVIKEHYIKWLEYYYYLYFDIKTMIINIFIMLFLS